MALPMFPLRSLSITGSYVGGLHDLRELVALAQRVTLPQIRPALISAIFLAFISSFDELVIAMFLGGSNMTLPKKMFDNILNAIDPTIAAVSVLQILIVSIALLVSARFGTGARPTL